MNLSQQSFSKPRTTTFEDLITTIPDFPRPGIQFKDIMPVLANPSAFSELISMMVFEIRKSGATKIVGLEARGFLLGIAIAQELELPFIPVRKAGKLPGEVVSVNYKLEYGESTIEVQKSAIKPGDRIAIVDDLLATGGTARAAIQLVEECHGNVCGSFFAIELMSLEGRKNLSLVPVTSVLHY
jgi:adenine phosphoribosyltransferase